MRLWSLLLILLVSPVGFVRPAPPPTTPASNSETEMERQVLSLVNAHRHKKGMGALTSDDQLVKQARIHSKRMADGEVEFGHDGFRERIAQTKIKLTAAAENVGSNQGMSDPARVAVEGWLKSRGHRTNIEGDYDLTGIGAARSRDGAWFFTQIFVATR